jgi:hypothetical protein
MAELKEKMDKFLERKFTWVMLQERERVIAEAREVVGREVHIRIFRTET